MVEIMIKNKKKSWPQVFRDGCEGAKLTPYVVWLSPLASRWFSRPI